MDAMATESKNSVGELLKQGRLRQRLSTAECSKRTHIATRYLEALEEEQWAVLPSESHRLGFLKLYCRFLGVPVEEALALYNQKSQPPSSGPEGPPTAKKFESKSEIRMAPRTTGWSPSSIPQVIALAIATLLLFWVVYHAVSPHLFEQNPMPWSRRRLSTQSRLIVPRTSVTVQKVRVKADADSWLRVTTKNELLFEGILPAGSAKEWSGSGPFQFKIGNVRALSLFWNDQPVNLQAGAHGPVNDIRIPPQ
jgi:transcriptional regulator with XRE-family HTH domain